MLWLLVRHPARYPLYRNALVASGALSLAVFALYPLAPPRFLQKYGFVDTIANELEGYRSFNTSALVNEYAAMSSLHFGWAVDRAGAAATVRHGYARRPVVIRTLSARRATRSSRGPGRGRNPVPRRRS